MSFNSEARLWISVKFQVIRLDWPTSNDVIAMEFAQANRSAAANRFGPISTLTEELLAEVTVSHFKVVNMIRWPQWTLIYWWTQWRWTRFRPHPSHCSIICISGARQMETRSVETSGGSRSVAFRLVCAAQKMANCLVCDWECSMISW